MAHRPPRRPDDHDVSAAAAALSLNEPSSRLARIMRWVPMFLWVLLAHVFLQAFAPFMTEGVRNPIIPWTPVRWIEVLYAIAALLMTLELKRVADPEVDNFQAKRRIQRTVWLFVVFLALGLFTTFLTALDVLAVNFFGWFGNWEFAILTGLLVVQSELADYINQRTSLRTFDENP